MSEQHQYPRRSDVLHWALGDEANFRLYHTNAEFKAGVDMVINTLPAFINAMAETADRHGVLRKQMELVLRDRRPLSGLAEFHPFAEGEET